MTVSPNILIQIGPLNEQQADVARTALAGPSATPDALHDLVQRLVAARAIPVLLLLENGFSPVPATTDEAINEEGVLSFQLRRVEGGIPRSRAMAMLNAARSAGVGMRITDDEDEGQPETVHYWRPEMGERSPITHYLHDGGVLIDPLVVERLSGNASAQVYSYATARLPYLGQPCQPHLLVGASRYSESIVD